MALRRRRRSTGGTPQLLPNLFADADLDHWPDVDHDVTGDPWDRFVEARTRYRAGHTDGAIAIWRGIAEDGDLETRHVLQAWRFLWANGVTPPADETRRCLGAVAQVAMGDRHDILVAYADGRVRAESHAGGAIIVEEGTAAIDAAAASFLDVGQVLADLLGTWDKAQLPSLPPGHSRTLVLTPGGMRFGQGAHEQLCAHALSGPFILAAAQLMHELATSVPTAAPGTAAMDG